MYSHMIPSVPQKQESIKGPSGIEISTVAWGYHHAPHHLLFVHGGYQAKECYREQYEALALAGCYVVGFDLPFHGQSGPLPKENPVVLLTGIWGESVSAVRSHYQMSESVIILAWSLGGLIVREYLSGQASPTIGGLVFVAPLLDLEEGMTAWQEYSPNTLTIVEELNKAQENFSGRTEAFVRFVEMLTHPPQLDYFTFGYNARSFFKAGVHLSGILASFGTGEVDLFLHSLRCPVLFIQGREDMLVPPQYTRSNVARIPQEHVTLVELPCGHSPHLEMPLAFNTAVSQFLGGISQGRTAPLMHSGGNEE